MDIDRTAEQKLLAETVDGLLEKRYDANARLALLKSEQGWSPELWQQYAQLGLLGLMLDERHGGAGMTFAELAVVMESFGRALVLEPYLGTVVLGAGLVAAAGTSEQQDALLPSVAAGETLLAFAYAEPGSRWSRTDVDTHVANGRLSGQKIAVLGGDSADHFVVTAREGDRLGLYLVAGADARRDAYALQDGTRGADVLFDGAPATPLGDVADAVEVIDGVLDVATAALCAEAVGAMERMLWLTVDYLKTRVQFGRPIAQFQSLQHRAANMYVSLEQARSLALLARLAVEADDVAQRRQTIRAAKLGIDAAARHVAQESIQLHGGIGMTMEYPVGHYAKRTTVIAKTFADQDLLVRELGDSGGLIAPA
jgi:alkylation response protein AidB-like acyl-CoA dehydrogenase